MSSPEIAMQHRPFDGSHVALKRAGTNSEDIADVDE
jgi:hypothetical protein